MHLWDIVRTIGTGVIASVAGPAAPLILGVINAALPKDKQLPKNATGQQAQDAISALPAAERAQVMDKQLDVNITEIKESHSTVRMMLESDVANPQSTRPRIALGAFHVIAFSIISTTVMWAYAVGIKDAVMVKTIMDGWPFIVGVNGTLATLLLAYFGVLRKEHKQKMDAALGQSPVAGIAGLIGSLIKR